MEKISFHKIEVGQKFIYEGNTLIRTHVDFKGEYQCVDVNTGEIRWLSEIDTFVIPV